MIKERPQQTARRIALHVRILKFIKPKEELK